MNGARCAEQKRRLLPGCLAGPDDSIGPNVNPAVFNNAETNTPTKTAPTAANRRLRSFFSGVNIPMLHSLRVPPKKPKEIACYFPLDRV